MAILLSDNFESGSFGAAWDAESTNDANGSMSVSSAAAIRKNYGLLLASNKPQFFFQETAAISELRVRFYIDPNSVSMVDNTDGILYVNYNSGWGNILIIRLRYVSPNYQISFYCRKDSGNNLYTLNITDDSHCVELYWKRSTGADDGICKIWIDDVLESTDTTIDNDLVNTHSIVYHYLGFLYPNAGNSGNIYLDEFILNNDGEKIGLQAGIPVIMNQYSQRRT